jgi:predicted AlkP superfamily phosphohydrolase/phosphomutase
MKNKVLIIGLDGGTWKILKPMMDNGIMPNLKKLVDNGASGILKSTVPPVTAPAWASFQTGVNPGKHGIYDFQMHNRGSKQLRFVNSGSLCYPTFWELAAERAYKVISINVPLTYPAKRVENWTQVGGFLSPRVTESFVHPKELLRKLEEHAYQIAVGSLYRRFRLGLDDFIDENINIEKKRFGLARELAQGQPWDLMMVHNQSIDGVQHVYYPYLDPNYPEYQNPDSRKIHEFYKATDDCIGKLIEICPDSTYVFVVSDHGFKRTKSEVNLNNWLSKKGFLRFNKKRILIKTITQFLVDLDKFNLRQKILGRCLKNLGGMRIAPKFAKFFLDWDNTKAYMLNGNTFGNIFLSCRQEDRSGLLTHITTELLQLADSNGQKVVKKVLESKKYFQGEAVDSLPDLFMEPEEDYVFSISIMRSRKIFYTPDKSKLQGTHHLDGIFVAYGPTIKQGRLKTASIMDVAPTVLGLLEVPIPTWMDGKVIDTIFHEKPKVRFCEQDRKVAHVSRETERASDEQIIRDRLKGLGYL